MMLEFQRQTTTFLILSQDVKNIVQETWWRECSFIHKIMRALTKKMHTRDPASSKLKRLLQNLLYQSLCKSFGESHHAISRPHLPKAEVISKEPKTSAQETIEKWCRCRSLEALTSKAEFALPKDLNLLNRRDPNLFRYFLSKTTWS